VEFANTPVPATDDTIPMQARKYRVRVKAVDSKGNASAYATGADVTVTPNAAPVISGADMDLGERRQVVKYQYTVSDADADDTIHVTEMLINGDKRWTLRSFEAGNGGDYVLDTAPYWLEVLGDAAIIIEAVDSLGAKATRTITLSRLVDHMAASRSFATRRKVEKCLFGIDLSALPKGAAFTMQACNNPYDKEPKWEDVSTKVNKAVHFFKNSDVVVPGFAYRFYISQGNEMFSLEKIVVKYA
jgi:hypothetical protein